MERIEAIRACHSVRKYTDKPIEKSYEADGDVPKCAYRSNHLAK